MAYSDFTLEKVKTAFDLEVVEGIDLFLNVQAIAPSLQLASTLAKTVPLASAINSEKARSELIIAPVLLEVWQSLGTGNVSLFSGIDFTVDSALGLTGFCDFILSRSSEQFYVQAPIVTLVEAKNENIKGGLGQCIAEMFAAQIFNESRGNEINSVLGIVTTGELWRFLTLQQKTVSIDQRSYFVNELGLILGILVEAIQR